MFRPLHLTLIEIKRYLADRGDLATSIALPIALFGLMYGVFGGGAAFNSDVHVADLDGGPAAQRFLAAADAVDGLTVVSSTEAELDRALDRTAILSGYVVPAGFSADLEAGRPTALVVRQRGSGGRDAEIVASILQGVLAEVAAEYELRSAVRALTSDAVPDAEVARVAGALAEQARAARLVSVEVDAVGGADEADFLDRLLPGVVVMFLLFSVMLSAQSLLEERRTSVLERLMTTRLSPGQLFLGKFLAGWSRGALQAFVLLALAFAALGFGGPAAFAQCLALAVVTAAAVSAMGLTIASVARSQEQATWGAVFVTLAMSLFGGSFFPLPESGAFELLSRLTLNRYAVDALEGILSGATTLGDHGYEVAVLAGVAVAGFAVARVLFRTSEGAR